LESWLSHSTKLAVVADLGAGSGRDLGIVRKYHPDACLHAVEYDQTNCKKLKDMGCETYSFDIEKENMPFKNESIDLIITNQCLEHTKEIFYILHEVSRCLRVGGYFIVGVPNIASLHNRIGLLFGKHPTQAKTCSAHVRCFSKNDFILFLNEGFPDGYVCEQFAGSQFYPFPRFLARQLAYFLPSMAFSIFFMLRKVSKYQRSFLEYPVEAGLETNYRVE
jgi:SAM-dependent methyltransferase